jgi:hypothetical protein
MNMIRIIFAIYLFIHGAAHLIGFLVPWRIVESEDALYKTKIYNNRIDVGHTGIRILGIMWLLIAFAFFYSAITTFLELPVWELLTLVTTVISFILCILNLPDTKFGIAANVIIIIFLMINEQLNWLM